MKTRHRETGSRKGDATPVNILGGLYYVGTEPASTHVIDTRDGLILIDSGYRESLHLVLHHMQMMKLDPRNIKYILHTHGHIDHAGATAELVRLTGAKTFLGKEDADTVMGKNALSYADEYGMEFDTFIPDVLLSDGDEIALGNTVIKCAATPGHTAGCMSFFFDVTDAYTGKVYRTGLHGGMGINTMAGDYLDKYSLSYDCRERFLAAMDRLSEEKVDIFLGNHMQHNDTVGKASRVLSGERLAFVNPEEWPSFNSFCKDNLLGMIKEEEEKTAPGN